MYRRLNITMDEDLLRSVDGFAARHRYSRSGLIAAAVRSFVRFDEPDPDVEALPVADHAEESAAIYHAGAVDRSMARPAVRETVAALRAFFYARADVEAAWLFGSVARGMSNPMSDIDVAVLPAEELDADGRWELRAELTLRLESALGRAVDVALVPDMGVVLAHRALVEGVRVFGEESTRAAEAEVRAGRAYWDSGPMRRMRQDRLSERLGIHGQG